MTQKVEGCSVCRFSGQKIERSGPYTVSWGEKKILAQDYMCSRSDCPFIGDRGRGEIKAVVDLSTKKKGWFTS